MHDIYRGTTCRPGRGHIVAASRLQLVSPVTISELAARIYLLILCGATAVWFATYLLDVL